MKISEWTIEKIRQLPKDNWLGIKRVGEHAWEIGGDIPNGMVMYTGDGGVVEYCTTFNQVMKESLNQDLLKDISNYINDEPKLMRLDPITPEYLEALIREELFSNCKKDGMA